MALQPEPPHSQPTVPQDDSVGLGSRAGKTGLALSATAAFLIFALPWFFSLRTRCLESDWPVVAFLAAMGCCFCALLCTGVAAVFGLMRLHVPSLIFSILTAGTLWVVMTKVTHPSDDPGADSAAVASLRTITTAEMTYAGMKATYGSIDDLIREGLLDTGFAGIKSSYRFSAVAHGEAFTETAVPAHEHKRSWHTGCWDYFENSDGVIHYSNDKSRSPSGKSGEPVG